mgnify:FL=1
MVIAVVLVEEVQVRNLVGWTSESVVARVPAYALSDCWGWLHCGWGISSERLDVILAMAAVAFTVGIVIKRRHRRKQQASPQ